MESKFQSHWNIVITLNYVFISIEVVIDIIFILVIVVIILLVVNFFFFKIIIVITHFWVWLILFYNIVINTYK